MIEVAVRQGDAAGDLLDVQLGSSGRFDGGAMLFERMDQCRPLGGAGAETTDEDVHRHVEDDDGVVEQRPEADAGRGVATQGAAGEGDAIHGGSAGKRHARPLHGASEARIAATVVARTEEQGLPGLPTTRHPENRMATYGKKAGDKVKTAMDEMKAGTLKSGGSGQKVTSRKQAIAIGLSEARKAGGKAPKAPSAKS